MLRNYLTVALRNLVRHKVYSFINIFGLAVGIAFCILSLLFVQHEWSYDRFHERADRIYLAWRAYKPVSPRKPWASTPKRFAPTALENLPEIECAVRLNSWNTQDVPVRAGDRVLYRSGLIADPEFFRMFSFPEVAGDLRNALHDRHSVVISQEMAGAYFGDDPPLGKPISIRIRRAYRDFVVAGVVDVPENSSMKFDFLVSSAHWGDVSGEGWGSNNVQTYLLVSEGVRGGDLERKFADLFKTMFAQRAGEGKSYYGGPDQPIRLMPFTDVYLNTEVETFATIQSDPAYAYILSGLALAVLLIACVNFMNLSVGLASTRFREVGMRKVLGATRLHLIRQFWGESILLSLLALGLAVALAELSLPVFNQLLGRQLTLDYGDAWGLLLGVALVVGMVSGSYPALVQSAFHPVEVLKGRMRMGGGTLFSRGLVALQFALSTVLVITTLLMARQMAFLRDKNLGFDPEQVVVIDTVSLGRDGGQRLLEHYRRAAEQYRSILNVSMASMSFGRRTDLGTIRRYKGKRISFRELVVDYDYLATMGMTLLAGREFSRDHEADQQKAVMVNEAMLELLGPGFGVGSELPFRYGGRSIVGVVKDFHIEAMHRQIRPAVFRLKKGNGGLRYILVRTDTEDVSATLGALRDTWEQVVPDRPMVYSFLDEDIDRKFRGDERWLQIMRYSALFAVFVACLGAFGLTSLAVARRTKEIGIRKVLGASVPNIVGLLSREFLLLVAVSNVVAWPIAYYAMERWLQDFAYRIGLGPDVFLLGSILALGMVLLAVGSQAVRAATANPVDALRYE